MSLPTSRARESGPSPNRDSKIYFNKNPIAQILLSCAPAIQSLNSTLTITDLGNMDRSQSNLAHQINDDEQVGPEHKPPTPTSSIESIFPTANANQLLELIAQGHNPEDLHKLIRQSQRAA